MKGNGKVTPIGLLLVGSIIGVADIMGFFPKESANYMGSTAILAFIAGVIWLILKH